FGRRSPWIAGGMALCLLALAGIPPMAGFFSKLLIFATAWQQGSALTWLVILALINSTISIAYYVNVIWRMYGVEPAKRERVQVSGAVQRTMAAAVFGIFALSVSFGWLLNQVRDGASGLIQALIR